MTAVTFKLKQQRQHVDSAVGELSEAVRKDKFVSERDSGEQSDESDKRGQIIFRPTGHVWEYRTWRVIGN